MDNEAIAVKCSLHGLQIVLECQSSSNTHIFSSYFRQWERSGRMYYVTHKINYQHTPSGSDIYNYIYLLIDHDLSITNSWTI